MQLLIHRASGLALLEDLQKFKLGGCWRPLFPILTVNFLGIIWALHHVPYIFCLFLTSATSFGWVVVAGTSVRKIRKMDKILGRPAWHLNIPCHETFPERSWAQIQANPIWFHPNSQTKTERLEQWKVGSTFSVLTQFQDLNCLEQECELLIDASVERRAERIQTQASRPRGGWPA